MTLQIEQQPSPYANDPYAVSPEAFPHADLYETRPIKGSGTLRRARAGWLIVAIVAGIGGFIAWDKMSGAAPAVAKGIVGGFGVGHIPEEKPQPEAAAEAVKTEEAKKDDVKKTTKSPPPPKRERALGSSDKFENPSQTYASKEVASWNSTSRHDSHKNEIAKRRNSALGN